LTFGEVKKGFEFGDFEGFWESEEIEAIREIGLLIL